MKSNKKYPKTTLDSKLLDHYTIEDFERALCKGINVQVLKNLVDFVDSFSKCHSVGLKIQAIMKKTCATKSKSL